MSTVTEPTQAEQRWLVCRIDQGMFSDELAVTYPAQGKWQKSVFVERNAVIGDAGSIGKVRVGVLRKNGSIIAVLPSPERDIVYADAGDISDQ
jgi:hypothetical protein